MLVLSRKLGQALVIGDEIQVTVQRVKGNRVTLGIQAPEHIHILRGELELCLESDDQEKTVSAANH
jgi:carbon storage regulator